MDTTRFYSQLFAPLEQLLGARDRDTLAAIIGFDGGGPLSFCTFGRGPPASFPTYASCELAMRLDQHPASFGRYELLVTCDDETWVRSVVSEIGEMSLELSFDDGHTLDIGPRVERGAVLQAVLFEKVCETEIDAERIGILRVIGITRAELALARSEGTAALVERLELAGVYPNTTARRASVA